MHRSPTADRPFLEQLALRAPRLVDRFAVGFARLPPGSTPRRRGLAWLMRRSFEGQSRRDIELTLLCYEPDVELLLSGAAGLGLAERYVGHDGWRRFYGDLYENFVEPRFTLGRVLDAGNRLVFAFHFGGKGRASGAEAMLSVTTAARFSAGGKIERQYLFWRGTWEDALEAAGLAHDASSACV